MVQKVADRLSPDVLVLIELTDVADKVVAEALGWPTYHAAVPMQAREGIHPISSDGFELGYPSIG